MHVEHGYVLSEAGTGVNIHLTSDDLAQAVDAWLVAQGVQVDGARTIHFNGVVARLVRADVYVDPSGSVIANGKLFSGRGPENDTPCAGNR